MVSSFEDEKKMEDVEKMRAEGENYMLQINESPLYKELITSLSNIFSLVEDESIRVIMNMVDTNETITFTFFSTTPSLRSRFCYVLPLFLTFT